MMRLGLRTVFTFGFLGASLVIGHVAARKTLAQGTADSAKKLKVYISVDMEGVAGRCDCGPAAP